MAGYSLNSNKANLLKVVHVTTDNVTVSANGAATATGTFSESGYTPLGIVGVYTENASSGGQYSTLCMIYSYRISGTNVHTYFRNTSTATAKIKVTAYVLCVKS